MTDAELAARLAETAGKLLLTLRDSGVVEGKALGAAGDVTANAWLMSALSSLRPEDAILSEERVDDLSRLENRRVWIVDPLDGTREYSEGREDWAVHVALSVDGHPAVGAVALPAQGKLLRSDQPPPPAARPERPRILVSRTRPPAECQRLAERMGAELVPMGSAGAKAMAVLLGQGDIYLHTGGQYQWDNAAPVAVALGAGMVATRVDGSPCTYNGRETLLPDLLICPPEYEARVREALGTSPP
jgi:3'(2'), 5'-bisphosphate nucleotidase